MGGFTIQRQKNKHSVILFVRYDSTSSSETLIKLFI